MQRCLAPGSKWVEIISKGLLIHSHFPEINFISNISHKYTFYQNMNAPLDFEKDFNPLYPLFSEPGVAWLTCTAYNFSRALKRVLRSFAQYIYIRTVSSHFIFCSGTSRGTVFWMGFYADISWESRCSSEIKVWGHLCHILVVFEVPARPRVKGISGNS